MYPGVSGFHAWLTGLEASRYGACTEGRAGSPELHTGGTNPKALRTHILRLLGLKTMLYKAFEPF